MKKTSPDKIQQIIIRNNAYTRNQAHRKLVRLAKRKGLEHPYRESIQELHHKYDTFSNLNISKNWLPVTWRNGYLCINAPPICSIRRNPNDFIEFISMIRYWAENKNSSLLVPELSRRYKVRSHGRTTNYAVDFGSVSEMTFAFALVTVAELSLIFEGRSDIHLPEMLYSRWSPEVIVTLHDIGFFDYFQVKNIQTLESEIDDIKALRVKKLPVSKRGGSQFDSGQATKSFMIDLREKFDFGEEDSDLASAISEALNNVEEHAYVNTELDEYYWVLGAQRKNTLRIYVYDKGQGIPSSMKANSIWSKLLGTKVNELTDLDLIKEAMKTGKSRTKKLHRGLGFPTMLNSLKNETDEKNSLRIMSGNAIINAESVKKTIDERELLFTFPGTLIEWIFELRDTT